MNIYRPYIIKTKTYTTGHSKDSVDGHSQFMTGSKPLFGYNGQFGYRRNTPWLRKSPSPFGIGSISATH